MNRAYKVAFHDSDVEAFSLEHLALSEQLRRALELLRSGPKVVAEQDPNRINSLQIRNWARREGISMAKKGHVPLEIENAYRRSHDLAVLKEEKQPRPAVDASPAEVRAWARENDIEVAVKGRVHPDVVRAYADAHPVL